MEALLHQMLPSNVPKAIHVDSGDGYSLGSTFPNEDYPITEWSASLWQYTESSLVISTSGPYCGIYWSGTRLTHTNGFVNNALTTAETLPVKWIFVQLGSTATMSYGAVTVLNGSQYYIASTFTITLTTSSVVQTFPGCQSSDVITI